MGQANARSDLRSQFDGPSGAPNLSAELSTSPGALRVPIVEDPLSAMGWILGIDEANLLTWDLPNVVVSFPVDFTFPIFTGILASIFGGLEIGTNLKVGLDTAGFSAYAKSKDLADLFQGFYVSDRANADGTGADVNPAPPLLPPGAADHPAEPESDRVLHGLLPALRRPEAEIGRASCRERV